MGESGSLIERLDLIGKGSFVRFKFYNANANEDYRIDGFSILGQKEGLHR